MQAAQCAQQFGLQPDAARQAREQVFAQGLQARDFRGALLRCVQPAAFGAQGAGRVQAMHLHPAGGRGLHLPRRAGHPGHHLRARLLQALGKGPPLRRAPRLLGQQAEIGQQQHARAARRQRHGLVQVVRGRAGSGRSAIDHPPRHAVDGAEPHPGPAAPRGDVVEQRAVVAPVGCQALAAIPHHQQVAAPVLAREPRQA